MAHAKGGSETSPVVKLATFIVDKRNLFFLLLIIGIIFSVFSTKWIQVENSLTEYLPEHSETRRGLDIMEDQFFTYGTAQVMVENLSLEDAQTLCGEFREIPGVQSIAYDEEENYKNVSALYTITFDYSETDDQCLEVLEAVKAQLTGHLCLHSPWQLCGGNHRSGSQRDYGSGAVFHRRRCL